MSEIVTYRPQPGDNAGSIPLGIDPATGTPIRLDLDQHPHLIIPAGPRRGATATLRMIAAYTAAHGAEVTLLVPKLAGYEPLKDQDGIRIHRDTGTTIEALHDFADSMTVLYQDQEDGAELPYRALLLIEHLETLTAHSRRDEHLHRALLRLHEVLRIGRGVRHHLVAATCSYSLAQLTPAREACAVLALGPRTRTERALLRLDRQPRTGPGAGVVKLPGQPVRDIQVTYLSPEHARDLVTTA
ncbi:hypothetical protein [Streptomyces sp. BPTC-684]|uniref:hypothetical protein n=1 Tax=Streptomyces sp. BPTC-684 TaxID=3043734 RepID=UPI0024B2207C|nr:hypothetical protein [Streptomyces sp. BPTC-684]WHM41140.1 hypothetical protein QIY60_32635 [Streptomyces sp. BPTC-684]